MGSRSEVIRPYTAQLATGDGYFEGTLLTLPSDCRRLGRRAKGKVTVTTRPTRTCSGQQGDSRATTSFLYRLGGPDHVNIPLRHDAVSASLVRPAPRRDERDAAIQTPIQALTAGQVSHLSQVSCLDAPSGCPSSALFAP